MLNAIRPVKTSLLALFSLAIAVSSRGIADDTEIYFNTAGASQPQGIRPNVLFVLDTSSSMNSLDGTSQTRLDRMKDALKSVLSSANNVNMGLMRFSNPGGPVLFPVANIDADVDTIETQPTIDPSVVQVQVSNGNDDAEEKTTDGSMYLTSTDLELIDDSGNWGPQVVGIRFQNVNVPQGVTIESAVIQFTVDELDSGATSVEFHGENVDNAAAFTGASGNISGRTNTAAEVAWNNIPAWDTVDTVVETPDLKTIVQEITDRTGWCGGNAMTFIIAGSGERTAESYDGEPGSAPVLIIDYDDTNVPPVDAGCFKQTVSAQVNNTNDDAEERPNGTMYLNSSDLELVNDSGNQDIGVRFQNLNIPQGATILSAELEFEIDVKQTQTTNLTIQGNNVDSAAAFGTTNNDISNRATTTASVDWNSVPALEVNQKLTSPDISAIVQEIANRAGWASGNAMAFIITGSGKREVESYDGEPAAAPVLRVQYQAEAGGGGGGGGGAVKTVRQRISEIVDELQYKSWTPIVDALYEAALYFRGDAVDYGTQRGDPSTSRREFTRVSHPASYTGGTVSRDAGCTDANLNAVACRTEQITGSPVYQSPITASCQTNFIILLSDGLPSVNNSVSKVESMIGASCSGSGNSKCGNELVQYLKDNDQTTGFAGDQTIKTYTIGFNVDGDPQYLADLAVAGGGSFYTANTAAELTAVFETILAEALAAPTSFTAPALSVNAFNRLFNRNTVFFALFEPDQNVRWIGNIKKYQIEADSNDADFGKIKDYPGNLAIDDNTFRIKNSAISFWGSTSTADGPTIDEGGAGAQIQAAGHAVRNVYTYTGSDDSPTAPIDLDYDTTAAAGDAHHLITSNTLITLSDLGGTPTGDPTADAQTRADIINWVRGQDINDENNNNVTTDTRWPFSDPLHSRPAPVTYGAIPCTSGDTTDSDSACFGLTPGDPNPDKPIDKIFVGTNDGALRMINESNGEEEWIFYLPELLGNQKALMDNAAGAHIYGVDGAPQVWVQDNNTDGIIDPSDNDFVRIIFGLRRGGKTLYALDVTPSSALTGTSGDAAAPSFTPKFMWRIKGGTGDFLDLGYTWSSPIPTKIRMGTGGQNSAVKSVLVFGGGYDNIQDVVTENLSMVDDDEVRFGTDSLGNAIFIVDPNDGSRIWWASGSADSAGNSPDLTLPGMDYSIPAGLALLDSNGDGETDRLYATDAGGQVWRIDLSPTLKVDTNAGTTGARLAAISDYTGSPAEADKRKFFYPVDVVQVRDSLYSTEAEYDIVPIMSGNRAHPLDLDVHNRVYAFRDYLIDDPIALDGSNQPTNYPKCVSGTVAADSVTVGVCPNGAPLTESNLSNVTANAIQDGNTQAAKTELIENTGWYFDLKEDSGWIGEKGLSKPVTLDGTLFFTTYIPTLAENVANTCTGAEGSGRLYGVNIYTAQAVLDWNYSGDLTKADRYMTVGGGIPSEAVPVLHEGGVTLLIGGGAGAASVDPDIGRPLYPTFWYQE